MLVELLGSTPWWGWMIVVLGMAVVFFLAVVLPAMVTQRGSRERSFVYQVGGLASALVITTGVLNLLDPRRQLLYTSLCLIGFLLFLGPWARKKQVTIRKSETKPAPNEINEANHGRQ